jgi:hypothetical protein
MKAICPTWCDADHDDEIAEQLIAAAFGVEDSTIGYLHHYADLSLLRSDFASAKETSAYTLYLYASTHRSESLRSAVNLAFDAPQYGELSPSEARRLAAQLLRAADRLEGARRVDRF